MIKANFSIATKIKCSAAIWCFFMAILSLKINAEIPKVAIQPKRAAANSYIYHYYKEAICQMIEYKIPASVILAQAIFESDAGKSFLAKRSNNHFGIKCHTEWVGDTIRKSDDNLNECFRSYKNVKDSYVDHSMFLISRVRYNGLFNLSVSDYKGWCYGLKIAGYATYPSYPEELIAIIEKYQLYEFDLTESLAKKSLSINHDFEIKESKFTPSLFSLKELFLNDLLWNDEKHLLIQSLEMIVVNPNKESDGIADN